MEQDKKRKVVVKNNEYKNKCIIKSPKLKSINCREYSNTVISKRFYYF